MPTENPFVAMNFGLDIGGVVGFFTSCDGLGSETEVIEQKSVDENGVEILIKIPGRLKFTDITLKRGVTSDMEIWNWRKLVEEGKILDARKNCSIIMYDQEGKESARWNFENAWPSKVSGPALNAGENAIGIEELTIVHEHMERIK